jgi:lantibiotic modifying enzyme
MQDSRETFLEAADFLGAKLCREAIWSGNRCNWTGPNTIQLPNGSCAIATRACGPELLDGTSGIALFLARLFTATQERVFRVTAEAAIRQALSRVDDISQNFRIGFYKGLVGVAYALTELSELLDIPKFGPMALLILEDVEKQQQTEQEIDVLSGSAGAITPLLMMHSKLSEDLPFHLATKQGANVLNRTLDTFGFAQGSAGMAWALAELSHVTGQNRFRIAGHERSSLDGNDSTRWSDGISGIGMALLREHELFGDHELLEHAKQAVEKIAKRLSAVSFDLGETNYSLAHGVTGEAEFLLDASRILNDDAYLQLAERVGRVGIECFRKDDLAWPCSGPDNTESPGLMTGLAGIGHFYLRLFDPQENASVLLVRSM